MMFNGKRRREVPGFRPAEFEQRIERARRLMTRGKLDGLLLTSEANVEYLSGFTTQFAWNTPTRPWYFIVPRIGEALAVIPEIGAGNWLATSWCRGLRTWASPCPENEGLDLLGDALGRIKRRYGRLGVELGAESRLGMPVSDLQRLERAIRPLEIADCVPVMRALRLIKSKAEIARIRRACQIVSDAFAGLPALLDPGDTEGDLVRKFQADILLRGADKTPYTAVGSGTGGYTSIIMGPSSRRFRKGDIFLIDTGSRYAGYFCDFDRNYAIGEPLEEVRHVHDALYRATQAGIDAARPGNTAEDLFRAQARVLSDAGVTYGNVGRFGHGLGKVMTEPPSHKLGDRTRLAPGMVLTIEPSAMYGEGKILVHEENLVVTEDRPMLLTRRAPREMPVI